VKGGNHHAGRGRHRHFHVFVWEIGHTSDFSTPAGRLCLPGQANCDSYDTAHWLGFSPLQIKPVTFANGSTATTPQCGGPFGPDSTYCDTVISPTP
jgi:hypothetical protein